MIFTRSKFSYILRVLDVLVVICGKMEGGRVKKVELNVAREDYNIIEAGSR